MNWASIHQGAAQGGRTLLHVSMHAEVKAASRAMSKAADAASRLSEALGPLVRGPGEWIEESTR